MNKDTNSIYQELYNCFISQNSTYSDKAKRFRSILEKFASIFDKEKMGDAYFLSNRLNAIYQESGTSYLTRNLSKNILKKLNDIVHNDKYISDLELKELYKNILLIIHDVTGVVPDIKSLILSGITKLWFTEGLNLEQTAAVLDNSKVINVNAGPGTGKTFLLIHKLFYYAEMYEGENIVVLSFTNSAATQLQQKCNSLIDKYKLPVEKYRNRIISTIHGYCYFLLSDYYKEHGQKFEYIIIDDSDIDLIAEDIASEYKGINRIEDIKALLIKPNASNLSKYVEDYKKRHNFIFVNEILDLFIEKANNPHFLEYLDNKIGSLLVDESQDLSSKMYKIIKILYERNNNINLFFVGDPRQNIFGFNGGSYKNFMDFITNNNLTISEHNLIVTYRCPQPIISLVNPLSFLDCKNPRLVMATNRDFKGEVKLISYNDTEEEAKCIAKLIQQQNNNIDTCIMCTWLNYLEPIAKCLNSLDIPFIVKGGKTTLHRVIKVLNICLRIKYFGTDKNRLSKWVEPETYSNIIECINQINSNYSISSTLTNIKNTLIETEFNDDDNIKLIEEYIKMAEDYDRIEDLFFDCSSMNHGKFSQFYKKDFNIESTALNDNQSQYVTISTIHSAKGLEWDNVFLMGVANNILPSWRCFMKQNTAISEELKNEEKKKYYVAVTRCKKNLYLSYAICNKGYLYEKSEFIILDF